MLRFAILLLTFSLVFCDIPKSCDGKPNTRGILKGKLQVTKSVGNGFVQQVNGSQILVVHLFGTAYEMGYA